MNNSQVPQMSDNYNGSNPLTVMQMIAANYRNNDHEVQKQLREVIKSFVSLKNQIENTDQESTIEMLRQGKEQLESLKRDLSQKALQQAKLYEVCRKRIHRHEELAEAEEDKQAAFELNAQLMQCLFSRGETQHALKLQEAIHEEAMFSPETELFEEAFAISAQIKNNNLLGVRTWADDNAHMLDKIDSALEFQLTCCEYLNLLTLKEWKGACACLRSGLAGKQLTKQQHSIVQKLAYLLVSQPPSFLERLLTVFKKSFAEIYSVSFEAPLLRHLSVGFSALKSKCCGEQSKRNPQVCPICISEARVVSERIPMLTKESSSLKCRVNGSIMDHENYPVALPSQHIYSITGLNQTASGDQYYCQVTETFYKKEQAKKVYLA